jgi:uncharacterized protein (TIGR00251 family)
MPSRFIQIRVKPNSRTSSLEQEADGTWLAHIKSPPVDGKANEELKALVAKHFACPKSDISIKSGGSGRVKLIQLEI